MSLGLFVLGLPSWKLIHLIWHMRGRYRLSRRKQLVEEYFASVSGGEEWNPRYNIAPTQPVPVIRPESESARPRTVTSPVASDPTALHSFRLLFLNRD